MRASNGTAKSQYAGFGCLALLNTSLLSVDEKVLKTSQLSLGWNFNGREQEHNDA